ncbi:MAG TPA: hypothetical protein VI542_27770, partial [Candidatus Tectomicrobia bacterium]
LNEANRAWENSGMVECYMQRHGVESAGILTVADDDTAGEIAVYLAPRIEGKTVVEIGGGIGLLALHMGLYAKRVYCIEAHPLWASSFLVALLANKPKHVSYLFGAAEEFQGQITGDVAVICSHSGLASMKAVAEQFAPVVIDVYGEIIASAPGKFDTLALALRELT